MRLPEDRFRRYCVLPACHRMAPSRSGVRTTPYNHSRPPPAPQSGIGRGGRPHLTLLRKWSAEWYSTIRFARRSGSSRSPDSRTSNTKRSSSPSQPPKPRGSARRDGRGRWSSCPRLSRRRAKVPQHRRHRLGVVEGIRSFVPRKVADSSGSRPKCRRAALSAFFCEAPLWPPPGDRSSLLPAPVRGRLGVSRSDRPS
jgi:hypothetical protein